MRERRRTRWLAAVAAVALLAGLPVDAAAATDLYPDLRMAIPSSFYIQTYGGVRRLRFTTFIRNGGRGPFVLHGSRPNSSAELMQVRQRIYRSDGTSFTISTEGVMAYAGNEAASDGHNHWHAQRVATYELFRYTGEYWKPVNRIGRKTGFCFFDTDPWDLSLPGAPGSRVYGQTCGTLSSTKVRMGLSVGWSDEYPASFAWQWIDVTGLDHRARYRVCVTADAFGWYGETDQTNNFAWAEVRWSSTGSTVRLVSRGTTLFGRRGARCGDTADNNRARLGPPPPGSVAGVVSASYFEPVEAPAGDATLARDLVDVCRRWAPSQQLL